MSGPSGSQQEPVGASGVPAGTSRGHWNFSFEGCFAWHVGLFVVEKIGCSSLIFRNPLVVKSYNFLEFKQRVSYSIFLDKLERFLEGKSVLSKVTRA